MRVQLVWNTNLKSPYVCIRGKSSGCDVGPTGWGCKGCCLVRAFASALSAWERNETISIISHDNVAARTMKKLKKLKISNDNFRKEKKLVTAFKTKKSLQALHIIAQQKIQAINLKYASKQSKNAIVLKEDTRIKRDTRGVSTIMLTYCCYGCQKLPDY